MIRVHHFLKKGIGEEMITAIGKPIFLMTDEDRRFPSGRPCVGQGLWWRLLWGEGRLAFRTEAWAVRVLLSAVRRLLGHVVTGKCCLVSCQGQKLKLYKVKFMGITPWVKGLPPNIGVIFPDTYGHSLEVPVTREQLNRYWDVAENVQSELAATLVKFECAQSELRDLRSKMLSKEVCCQELKAEMESYKESNARKSSLVTSLRDRVHELEEELAALSTSKSRIEITAQTATKESKRLMKKVTELGEQLQKCSMEKDETKKEASENFRRHEEFLTQLGDCLDPERTREETLKDFISKVRKLCEENASLRGQVVTLEEAVNAHEMEAKANRETIMRLSRHVGREGQKKSLSGQKKSLKLSKDLLGAMEAKEALGEEVKILQERLLTGQRAWATSKQEVSLLKTSTQELETSLQASREAAMALQSQNATFRQQIAALLPCTLEKSGSTEDAILERIRELGDQEESRERMVSQLEAQIAELTEQLGKESEFHREALQRAHAAENKSETLQSQLTHLEGELVSGDVLRDNLNAEKEKCLKFLDQLSEKMNLSQVAAELGFDMQLGVILARTEQLARLESLAITENKTIAHNLQRKLKTQKERLESKELHLSLLRRKIAQLEEERHVQKALTVERDEAHLTIRKLEKKVERMQKELSMCRESNTELKAKLADTNELKIKTLEQTKAIEDLNKSRDRLEKVKEKVEKQLTSVKSELGSLEHEARENKERSRTMIQVVTSEVKTLKQSLEEAMKREKQLVDFREIVSQMLGLNMTTLALPDYEIIKCLERLIHLHQHHFVTCACVSNLTTGQDRHLGDHLKFLH
ncbi:PREDICTED: coiled-coil domain-containing protein 170 [Dipodomys ordii]|uniref:Coiled-coil domain-containing protein 170 n=1 Tax=Dipodomys ordii TaxID=10020 RepID=A0A1S3G0Q1_DIPOR|nr:PREDICTED: coiled-coil domain-containing protein 170 [Dipodomys ordii]